MRAPLQISPPCADKEGMGEKRTESRIPLMARVEVLCGDVDGTPRIAPAILEDKSASGLSVRLKAPIRVGAHVTVRWGSEQVSGIITNSRRDRAEYLIGVKREPDDRFE
jgi:hypothetical protein